MARLARVIAVNTPHHVTQRGNARQRVFESDADHLVYLELLRRSSRQQGLSLIGYCLMPNHVHVVVVPSREESLPLALKHAHGRYATYYNARHASSGHLWQGRYYSCPLDQAHLWTALRYVERNPVRAGMIAHAEQYMWSSAGVHCGSAPSEISLAMELWEETWNSANWREFLTAGSEAEAEAIRRSTHTGRPLGSTAFIAALEETLCRSLTLSKGGRPRHDQTNSELQSFAFGQQ